MHDVAVWTRGSESSMETDEAAAWAGSTAQLHYVSRVEVSLLPSRSDPGRRPLRPSEGFKIQILHIETTGEGR